MILEVILGYKVENYKSVNFYKNVISIFSMSLKIIG